MLQWYAKKMSPYAKNMNSNAKKNELNAKKKMSLDAKKNEPYSKIILSKLKL